MNLSRAEEQLMAYLWRMHRAFMKDLLEAFPNPKPAATTVATLLKRMHDKGFIGYTVFGNSREYHPLVKKEDYFSRQVSGMIRNNFNGSPIQFASFFTRATNLTEAELKELKKIIDCELEKKKK